METLNSLNFNLFQLITIWGGIVTIFFLLSFLFKAISRLATMLLIIFMITIMFASFIHITKQIPFQLNNFTGKIFIVAAFISLLAFGTPFSKELDKLVAFLSAISFMVILGYVAAIMSDILQIERQFILHSFLTGLIIPPIVGWATKQPIIGIIVVNIISYLMVHSEIQSPNFTITSKNILETASGMMLSWGLGVTEGFFFLSPENKRRYYLFVILDGACFLILMYIVFKRAGIVDLGSGLNY